jgi:hypothetical protein
MEKTVRKILRTCDICQKAKINNQKQEGLMQHVIPDAPLAIVAVDLFGPLPKSRGGVTYIFVVLDMFTKFVKLYPVKKATSLVLANKIVHDYMNEIGKP